MMMMMMMMMMIMMIINNNNDFLKGYISVNNPIHIAVFFKHVAILYYTCPNFLTFSNIP